MSYLQPITHVKYRKLEYFYKNIADHRYHRELYRKEEFLLEDSNDLVLIIYLT